MISQSDLVKKISKKSGHTQKEVKDVLDSFIDVTTNCLSSGFSFRLHKFGRFDSEVQENKCGYDINRAKIIRLPKTLRVRFRPSDHLLKMMNYGSDKDNNFSCHNSNNVFQDEDTKDQFQ